MSILDISISIELSQDCFYRLNLLIILVFLINAPHYYVFGQGFTDSQDLS